MKRNVCLLVAGTIASVLNLCTAHAAATPVSKTGLGPSFKGPVGLQLYSLRDEFKTNVAGTLAKVRAYGFSYVELAGTYGLAPEQFKKMLDQNQLIPVAAHFPYEALRDNLESVARDAKALGLKYAGCAWIPHQGDFDEKQCREAITVFNRAGEALAKQGLKFFYHVHGYEFQPFGTGTLLDLMMKETKPALVSYEMDIFWVVFPNQDPVKLLAKYGKRWELMHLKDMKVSTITGALTGGTDVNNDVAIGAGKIEMGPLLRQAKRIGIKYYFIEDESSLAGVDIPVSLRYLETVRF